MIWIGRRRQKDTEAVIAKIKEDQKKEQTATRDDVVAAERLAAGQSTV